MRQKRFILAMLATAMAINELQNRHSGPGGSTRRLHHKAQISYGGEAGSTRVVKAKLSLGMIPPISGQTL